MALDCIILYHIFIYLWGKPLGPHFAAILLGIYYIMGIPENDR